jgi:putative heme-binding domain-containing protein
MLKLMYCLALLTAVSAVHAAEEHTGTYGEADIERGARVYYSTCVACHGPNGDSIPQVNLRSNHFNRAATDEELIRVINGGIAGTGMPANNLEAPDQTAIVAFIRNMDARLSDAAAAGDAAHGKLIFEGKGDCLKCHRVNGAGGRTAPDLSDIGLARTARQLIQKLHDPASMILPANRSVRAVTRDGTVITGRRLNEDTWSVQLIDSNENLVGLNKADLKAYAVLDTTPMPAYQGVLSDSEIGDVVGYLLSLKGLN